MLTLSIVVHSKLPPLTTEEIAMPIRPHRFIAFVTVAALATDIALVLNGTVPQQVVIAINMSLLVILGAPSVLLLRNLNDTCEHLKTVVEKLQTPGGYLQEDFDLEENPDEAFMRELDPLVEEARARMRSAVDTGPPCQP